MLTPLDVAPFVPTDKRAGDIVIYGHASYRVRQDGSWQASDEPRDTTPSCEAVQSTPLWQFALCGLGMGVLVALFCAGVL